MSSEWVGHEENGINQTGGSYAVKTPKAAGLQDVAIKYVYIKVYTNSIDSNLGLQIHIITTLKSMHLSSRQWEEFNSFIQNVNIVLEA